MIYYNNTGFLICFSTTKKGAHYVLFYNKKEFTSCFSTTKKGFNT